MDMIIDFPGEVRVDAHFRGHSLPTDQPSGGGGENSALIHSAELCKVKKTLENPPQSEIVTREVSRECLTRWAKIELCKSVQTAKQQPVKTRPAKPMRVRRGIGVCTASGNTRLIRNRTAILKVCENGLLKCM
jgi:hypothetical protein